MIRPTYATCTEPLTKRETVAMLLASLRGSQRAAELACDGHLSDATDAANRLHLLTAWRHIRRAWGWYKRAVEHQRHADRCERAIARMGAS